MKTSPLEMILDNIFSFTDVGDHICRLLTSNRTFWEKEKKRAIYLGATAKK